MHHKDIWRCITSCRCNRFLPHLSLPLRTSYFFSLVGTFITWLRKFTILLLYPHMHSRYSPPHKSPWWCGKCTKGWKWMAWKLYGGKSSKLWDIITQWIREKKTFNGAAMHFMANNVKSLALWYTIQWGDGGISMHFQCRKKEEDNKKITTLLCLALHSLP